MLKFIEKCHSIPKTEEIWNTEQNVHEYDSQVRNDLKYY